MFSNFLLKYSSQTFKQQQQPVHVFQTAAQSILQDLGLVWIEGGVEGSRVVLAENRLILGQLYSTPPQSKQTIM